MATAPDEQSQSQSNAAPGDAPLSAYAGIFVATAAVLMLEILLTRLFSFSIWYHLAYLTISTALLGFGAAGSILAGFPALLRRPSVLCAAAAAAAGVATLAGMYYLAPRPIDPANYYLARKVFFVGLLSYYAILIPPFLFAGLAIAAPLSAYPKRVNRLYSADLAGAAAGCALAVAALKWGSGPAGVFLAVGLFFVAAGFYAHAIKYRVVCAALAAAVIGASPWSEHVLAFRATESKGLGENAKYEEFEILFTKWSPINRVDVSRTGTMFRGGFWAALADPERLGNAPNTMQIWYDAHNGSDMYEYRGAQSMEFLDKHFFETPYIFLDKPRVLVIGLGGGIDVLNALRRGAAHVTVAELQPITLEVLTKHFADFTGHVFDDARVSLNVSEGRHYVRSHDELYDLIQITATDTFSAQATGAYVLAESHLYTVEAMEDYFDHLTPGGLFCIVVGDMAHTDPQVPPPLATRLLLSARDALENKGIAEPWRHLILTTPQEKLPGYQSVLIAKKAPFTPEEIARADAFTAEIGDWMRVAPGRPGFKPMTDLVRAQRSERHGLLRLNPYHVVPATDDRPFFYHVLHWRSILSTEPVLWYFPGSATGQNVLVMMLAQAVVIGSLLIGLPLLRRSKTFGPRRYSGRFLSYFLALGLGFMLIEISFVQKYVLMLGYPTYSLSVTIVSLLGFSAVGAAISRIGWNRPAGFLTTLLALTTILVVAEVLFVPRIHAAMLGEPLLNRIVVTALLQCPLGICLGMYFPTGIELLRRHSPGLVPWAWAVNGIGSVASTVLAVILAMTFGFSTVAIIALGVYLIGTAPLIYTLFTRGLEAQQ